jgi:hypothetical protein
VEGAEQAWDRQIEADAEGGKFDQLAEEALDYREREVHPAPVKFGSTLFVADPASVKFKAIKLLGDGNQVCSPLRAAQTVEDGSKSF